MAKRKLMPDYSGKITGNTRKGKSDIQRNARLAVNANGRAVGVKGKVSTRIKRTPTGKAQMAATAKKRAKTGKF